MERENNMICNRIRIIIAGIKRDIQILYGMPDLYTRNMLLKQILYKVDELEFLSSIASKDIQRQEAPSTSEQRVFTPEELAKYDGKNGNPAYIAVAKVVYDVTNNAAWAAGTHFGSQAGKDVSGAFATCHKGEAALSKLAVVGIMA